MNRDSLRAIFRWSGANHKQAEEGVAAVLELAALDAVAPASAIPAELSPWEGEGGEDMMYREGWNDCRSALIAALSAPKGTP